MTSVEDEPIDTPDKVAVDCNCPLALSAAVPITVPPLRNCTLPVGLLLPAVKPGSEKLIGVTEGSLIVTEAVMPKPVAATDAADTMDAAVAVLALLTTCVKVACSLA